MAAVEGAATVPGDDGGQAETERAKPAPSGASAEPGNPRARGRWRAWLKQRSRKVVTLALRQLLRLVREYPREPLLGAVREAARYGLYDLDRLERMILRRVTREYFRLDGESDDD